MEAVIPVVQQLGALGILALLVWSLPSIFRAVSDLIGKFVGTVRETQSDALAVFKTELQSLIEMMDRRFQNTETILTKQVETQTTMVVELTKLNTRVENLERDKPK